MDNKAYFRKSVSNMVLEDYSVVFELSDGLTAYCTEFVFELRDYSGKEVYCKPWRMVDDSMIDYICAVYDYLYDMDEDDLCTADFNLYALKEQLGNIIGVYEYDYRFHDCFAL